MSESALVPAPAPAPLGWCTRCLANDEAERPAVTMHRGNGLCRDCNATASAESQRLAALQEGMREVRTMVDDALKSVRRR